MKMFKPGDKVIFLNEKGGGVVTSVVDDQIVLVSVDDGFEIPYSVKDLLKSGVNDPSDYATGRATAAGDSENSDMTDLFHIPNKSDQRPSGVYLAMRPTDKDNMLKSSIDIYIINHSDYQLLFSMYLNRSGIYHGLDFGYIDAESKLFIKTIERTDIQDWSNGLVQLVFYMEGKALPLQPASAPITLKPVKVYKEDSFQYEGLLRDHALIIELTTTKKQAQYLKQDSDAADSIKHMNARNEHSLKPDNLPKKEGFIDKHKLDDTIAEVDLHIAELTADTSRLSNVEMLKIQLAYVEKCMDHARTERLSKIIFIHGIGNGTLKNEILRLLRQTEGIEFYDAPYARYGMGATEVSFYKHV